MDNIVDKEFKKFYEKYESLYSGFNLPKMVKIELKRLAYKAFVKGTKVKK